MNIKAVIHAVQQRAHKTTTIVRRATKFSPEQRRNTTLSQAVVEVVNDSQNGTPISSFNIKSISTNNTCVKDFLDDPLQETFDTDVYQPLNIREVYIHKRRLEILIRDFISKHRPLHPNENPDNAGTTNELTKAETTYLK